MGTWGPGNFENDTAADYLLELCEPLLEHIEATVGNPKLLEPDEYDSEVMMCNLELLACLAEHLGRYANGPLADFLFPRILPEPDVIAGWKTQYLAVWDSYIDGLSPTDDYKVQRRGVIVETFERVERLARTQSEDGS